MLYLRPPTGAEQFTIKTFSFTCTGASIGQVRRDGDCPALIHTHALQAFINASDESALPEQAHLGVSFLMAVKENQKGNKDKGNVRSRSTLEDVNSGERKVYICRARACVS